MPRPVGPKNPEQMEPETYSLQEVVAAITVASTVSAVALNLLGSLPVFHQCPDNEHCYTMGELQDFSKIIGAIFLGVLAGFVTAV